MQQLIHSAFMQALGYAIVNSLWQFGLLWLIYLVLNSVFNLTSHLKYITGLALQFTGFIWFLLTIVFYYNQTLSLVNIEGLPTGLLDFKQISYTGSFRSNVIVTLFRTGQFLPYLSFAYIIILVALGVKWVQSLNNTLRLRTNSLQKIDVGYRLFVEKLCYQMGIKPVVKIYLSYLIKSPLTIGFLKPLILIPAASINYLSVEQMEAVLLHEISHIRRSDFFMNILLSVIEVALFFNPFMQLLSRHIKRERENSCDDWVLQYEYNATNYAKALLKIATAHAPKTNSTLAVTAVDQKHTLLIRVKRMLEKKDRTYNYRNQLFALILLSGGLFLVACLTPSFKHADRVGKQAKAADKFTKEPQEAIVDNPLFNPAFYLLKSKELNVKIADEKEMFESEAMASLPAMPEMRDAFKPALVPAVAEGDKVSPSLPNKNFLNDNAYNNIPVFFTDSLNLFLQQNLSIKVLEEKLAGIEIEFNRLKISPGLKKGVAITSNLETAIRAAHIATALKQLKLVIAKQNEREQKLVAQKKQLKNEEEATRYFEKIYNQQELQLLSAQLQQQFEEVNLNSNNPTREFKLPNYNGVEGYITLTPNVEKNHTYSYDYNEIGATSTTAPARVSQEKPQPKKVEGIDRRINEGVFLAPPAPLKRTVRILKTVRI